MEAVISLLGRSYCGSSVTNLILGAHPKVFGAGELHRLHVERHDPNCRFCGAQCKFWTPKFKQQLTEKFEYQDIIQRSNRSVIVDASKTTGWFEKIQNTRHDLNFVDICLAKHPIRHLSSFVDNQYFRDKGLNQELRDVGGDVEKADLDLEDLADYVEKMSGSLLTTYKKCLQAYRPNSTLSHILQYESVITDRRSSLSPILESVGLEYDSAIDDYATSDHHSLGGNSGAHFVVKKNQTPEKQRKWWDNSIKKNKISPFRDKYYSNVKDVAVDNKFLHVLPNRIKRHIVELDTYKEHCDILGYKQKLEDIL